MRYYRCRPGHRAGTIQSIRAGVVQWQNVSFPSSTRGFDSLHPLQVVHNKGLTVRSKSSKKLIQNSFSEQVQDHL
jgi:hypothetical protein